MPCVLKFRKLKLAGSALRLLDKIIYIIKSLGLVSEEYAFHRRMWELNLTQNTTIEMELK